MDYNPHNLPIQHYPHVHEGFIQAQIDKLVGFLVRHRHQIHVVLENVRQKELRNPNFSFLFPSDRHYPNFQQKLFKECRRFNVPLPIPGGNALMNTSTHYVQPMAQRFQREHEMQPSTTPRLPLPSPAAKLEERQQTINQMKSIVQRIKMERAQKQHIQVQEVHQVHGAKSQHTTAPPAAAFPATRSFTSTPSAVAPSLNRALPTGTPASFAPSLQPTNHLRSSNLPDQTLGWDDKKRDSLKRRRFKDSRSESGSSREKSRSRVRDHDRDRDCVRDRDRVRGDRDRHLEHNRLGWNSSANGDHPRTRKQEEARTTSRDRGASERYDKNREDRCIRKQGEDRRNSGMNGKDQDYELKTDAARIQRRERSADRDRGDLQYNRDGKGVFGSRVDYSKRDTKSLTRSLSTRRQGDSRGYRSEVREIFGKNYQSRVQEDNHRVGDGTRGHDSQERERQRKDDRRSERKEDSRSRQGKDDSRGFKQKDDDRGLKRKDDSRGLTWKDDSSSRQLKESNYRSEIGGKVKNSRVEYPKQDAFPVEKTKSVHVQKDRGMNLPYPAKSDRSNMTVSTEAIVHQNNTDTTFKAPLSTDGNIEKQGANDRTIVELECDDNDAGDLFETRGSEKLAKENPDEKDRSRKKHKKEKRKRRREKNTETEKQRNNSKKKKRKPSRQQQKEAKLAIAMVVKKALKLHHLSTEKFTDIARRVTSKMYDHWKKRALTKKDLKIQDVTMYLTAKRRDDITNLVEKYVTQVAE